MIDTYTPEEFVECAKLRGYYVDKKFMETWMGRNAKQEYTDSDFEQLWHDSRLGHFNGGHCKLYADGQNGQNPSQSANSWQPRQETILQKELIHNQNFERKLKEKFLK